MTFEEYAKAHDLYFTEDYESDEFQIAREAWDAGFKQCRELINTTGYVLVPLEPTEAMVDASGAWNKGDAYSYYKAMVSAAQEEEL